MSSDRTVHAIGTKCTNIRQGEHETLYNETMGAIKHSPSPMKFIPINEAVALGTETSATKGEYSFTVMQHNDDDTFINHGLN